MALYTPGLGGEKDGLCCDCGKPATTEMMSGRCHGGGAQYAELCDECFQADFVGTYGHKDEMPKVIDHCTSFTAELEFPAPPGTR